MPRGVYARKVRPIEERFWQYVQKTDTCWNWIGSNSFRFKYNGETEKVSRVAWFIQTGSWPKNHILHNCNNLKCVRLDHLRDGTQHELFRKRALEQGLIRYFTGIPCIRGHIADRLVSNTHCVICQQERWKRNRRSTPEKRIKQNKIRSKLRLKQLKAGKQLPYKIRTALRTRLYLAIKGGYKNGSTIRDLGCTIKEFKLYIESHFVPGMTWENWGRKKAVGNLTI